MQSENTIICLEHVAKQYQLGTIGGTTLRDELQRKIAKIKHKEDPTAIIGSAQNVSNEKFWALKDISFCIDRGEAVGIIGHNGAGKSTLLKLLCRVTAPTKGKIMYNGRITSMLEVGTGFHPELTGRENIYLNGAILGMTRDEINQKMEEIIEFSECRQFIDTPVKRYSSGMYVKLAFAVASHLDSEIVIMDEVLAVGDMRFQKKCLQKMREAAKEDNRTVLYVSHNMSTIRQLCDRCIVLNKGEVEFIGDVEPAIERYLGLAGSLSCYYEYGEEFHSHKRDQVDLNMEKLEILGKNESRYALGENIRLRLSLRSFTVLENIKIRFEVQFQDSTVAGTALLGQALAFVANETKELEMEFSPGGLTPGKYRVDMVAYVYNDLGIEHFLDGVYPGFMFEIEEKIDENNELIWNHQYWGHVRLPDVSILLD